MSSTSSLASKSDANITDTLPQLIFQVKRALRIKQVQDKTGMSRSSIYAKAKIGEFPTPIKLGTGRTSAWLEHEVEQWLQQQIDASRGDVTANFASDRLRGEKS